MWPCEMTSQIEYIISQIAEDINMKLNKVVASCESIQPLKSNGLALLTW